MCKSVYITVRECASSEKAAARAPLLLLLSPRAADREKERERERERRHGVYNATGTMLSWLTSEQQPRRS